MKLSKERRQALYRAIEGPIMKQRIANAKRDVWVKAAVDDRLYRLELTIWNRVKAALNIEGDE